MDEESWQRNSIHRQVTHAKYNEWNVKHKSCPNMDELNAFTKWTDHT